MSPRFREYKHSDYATCERLVSNAWGFEKNFQPQELADIAKCLYTKGSLVSSNYQQVVEVDGCVVGFIFGRNTMKPKPKGGFLFGVSILWRLLRTQHTDKQKKKKLLAAMKQHQINRRKVVQQEESEVVLFVVDDQHQGQGFGQHLLAEFLTHCETSGIKRVIVETNKLEASGFYEKAGFQHLSDFDSPLHAYATPNGQACIYEYRCSTK